MHEMHFLKKKIGENEKTKDKEICMWISEKIIICF